MRETDVYEESKRVREQDRRSRVKTTAGKKLEGDIGKGSAGRVVPKRDDYTASICEELRRKHEIARGHEEKEREPPLPRPMTQSRHKEGV